MRAQQLSASTPIILTQWVPTLLRWFPLRHGVVVGRSQLALQHLNAAPHSLSLFKASANQAGHGQTHEQVPSPAWAGHPQPNINPWLIAGHNGLATCYQASLPAESGLLSPQSLKPCWPGIQCVSQHELPARTLDAAWHEFAANQAPLQAPNWLWVGSLPAAPVLAGATQLLQQADAVAVRVTLEPELEAHAGMQAVQDLLAAQGLVLCGIEPERNPKLGIALFVRDHPAAHAHARQLLQEQSRAQAELQARLQAEIEAKQAEAAAKVEAVQQCEELAKAKADLQGKLEAESKARQSEAAAKAEAVQQRDELVKAKADLQAKLEAETQAKQAEVAAKAEAVQQREELAKANADLQAKLDAETQAKQAEAAAKAEAVQQRDELAKANADLQAKLEAESKARQSEAAAKAEAVQQRDELVKAKADLQAKLEAETQAKQADAAAKAEAVQQRDEAAKAKADLQAKLDAESKARKAEAAAKQELQQNRDEIANEISELKTKHTEYLALKQRVTRLETDNQQFNQQQKILREELLKAETQIELVQNILQKS